MESTLVFHARAAELLGVTVEYLAVFALLRHADAVVMSHLGREVAEDDEEILVIVGLSDEGDDGVLAVVAVDPLEAVPVEVNFPERTVFLVELVQGARVFEHLRVHRVLLDEMPIEAVVVIPLDELRELAAHEEELLARMRHPIAEEAAQSRELLPVVAGHLAHERALAVHDLVVRQGQHEVLAEGIHKGERDLVLIPLAVDGVEAHVREHVVHPAHVPLVVESHAAHVDGLRDQRPCRRLFGDHQSVGMELEDRLVELLDEVHGFQVARVSVLVRLPLAVLPAVVQVEHVGDGVDAQTVDVVLFEPEHSVGDEEALHFRPAVVEVRRAPLPVLGALLVVRFVERHAVEVAKPLLVLAEVAGHPVHDDGDAVRVRRVDEVTEVIRLTVAARDRVVPRRLIAPRSVKRMLAERHDFDVRIVHLLRVADELIGKLAIRQIAAFKRAPPRA